MRHRLYFHLVWTTRAREQLIDAGRAVFLCRFLREMTLEDRARLLEAGMVSTHVHLLIAAHPLTHLPQLVQRLKGASAFVANRERHGELPAPLYWAPGYNVETVTPGLVDRVRLYLRNQAVHHPADAIPSWAGDVGVQEHLR
jgi:putative transposase